MSIFKKSFDTCNDTFVLNEFLKCNDRLNDAVSSFESSSSNHEDDDDLFYECAKSSADDSMTLQSLYLQRIHIPRRFARIQDNLRMNKYRTREGEQRFKEIEDHFRSKVNKLISENNFKEEHRECYLTEASDKPILPTNSSILAILKKVYDIFITPKNSYSIKIDILLHTMILKSRQFTPKCITVLEDYFADLSNNHVFLSSSTEDLFDRLTSGSAFFADRYFDQIELNKYYPDNIPKQHYTYDLTKAYILESYTVLKLVCAVFGKRLSNLDKELRRQQELKKACKYLVYFSLLLWLDIARPTEVLDDDGGRIAALLLDEIQQHPMSNKDITKISVFMGSQPSLQSQAVNPRTIYSAFCRYYDELPTSFSNRESILTFKPSHDAEFVKFLVYNKQFNTLTRLTSIIALMQGTSDYFTRKLRLCSLYLSNNLQSEEVVRKICQNLMKTCFESANYIDIKNNMPGRIRSCLHILLQSRNTEGLRGALEYLHSKLYLTDQDLFKLALDGQEFNFAEALLNSPHLNLRSDKTACDKLLNLFIAAVAKKGTRGVSWLCERSSNTRNELIKKIENSPIVNSNDDIDDNRKAVIAYYISLGRYDDLIKFAEECISKASNTMMIFKMRFILLLRCAIRMKQQTPANDEDKIVLESMLLKATLCLLYSERTYINENTRKNSKKSNSFPYLDLSYYHFCDKLIEYDHHFHLVLCKFKSNERFTKFCFELLKKSLDPKIKLDNKLDIAMDQLLKIYKEEALEKCMNRLALFGWKDSAIDLKLYPAFSPVYCGGMSSSDNQYSNWLLLLDTLYWADSASKNWILHKKLLDSSTKYMKFCVTSSTITPVTRYLSGCVYVPNTKECQSLHTISNDGRRRINVHSDLNSSISCLLKNGLITQAAELACHIGAIQKLKIRSTQEIVRSDRTSFKRALCSPLSSKMIYELLDKLSGSDDEDGILHYYSQELSDYFSAYSHIKPVGQGTYGLVHLYQNPENREMVVRKVPVDLEDEAALEMVFREKCIMKILNEKQKEKNSNSIVQLIDDEDDNSILMEYLKHGDLRHRLITLNKGGYTEVYARNCIRNILEAVELMHENNIIHRDLKLTNIMMAKENPNDQSIKIIDFGFSVQLRESQQDVECNCGTEVYCAPEIWANLRSGKPADMWAVGVILHVLLTGKLPFPGKNRVECEKSIKSINIKEALDRLNVSEQAKDLMCHLLDSNPLTRYTASAALRHNWFKTAGGSGNVDAVPGRLQEYDSIHEQVKTWDPKKAWKSAIAKVQFVVSMTPKKSGSL